MRLDFLFLLIKLPWVATKSKSGFSVRISLVPFSEEDFLTFEKTAIRDYAEAVARAEDLPRGVALAQAQTQHEKLLPKGLRTPSHFFFSIESEGNLVGFVWVQRHKNAPKRQTFIYQLMIYKPFRGKGFGRATLRELERSERKAGARSLGLHVFAYSTAALNLYRKCGYREIGIRMAKML